MFEGSQWIWWEDYAICNLQYNEHTILRMALLWLMLQQSPPGTDYNMIFGVSYSSILPPLLKS